MKSLVRSNASYSRRAPARAERPRLLVLVLVGNDGAAGRGFDNHQKRPLFARANSDRAFSQLVGMLDASGEAHVGSCSPPKKTKWRWDLGKLGLACAFLERTMGKRGKMALSSNQDRAE
jgi:hypothetical protein